MAFCLTNQNLPYLPTYGQLEAFYEKAVVQDNGWRGLNTGGKGVSRRDTTKRIRVDADGKIYLRYHQTDLVTWESPTEVRVRCHDSPSSGVFTAQFLPRGFSANSHKYNIYLVDQQKREWYRPALVQLRIVCTNGAWAIDPETVQMEESNVLDKKKAAAIRKTLKPFFDWHRALRRLDIEFRQELDDPAGEASRLQYCLKTGEIPVEAYREFAVGPMLHASLPLMPRLYVLGGAVSRVELPIGSLPRPTPYDFFRSMYDPTI